MEETKLTASTFAPDKSGERIQEILNLLDDSIDIVSSTEGPNEEQLASFTIENDKFKLIVLEK